MCSSDLTDSQPIVAWLYLGMFATIFLVGLRSKLHWTVRTSNLGRGSKIHSWILVYALGLLSWLLPSSVIYCSKQALNWHRRKALWKRGVVVLNGVRSGLKERRPLYSEVPPRNPLKIVVIARLNDQKGQRWLLDVLASTKQLLKDGYRLSFYGRNVPSLIREYGHLDNLEFYQGEDSFSILPKYDVLLMPSLYGEGYPNIIAEALAAGVYVIASDTGSIDEFNLHRSQIFPPGNFVGLKICLDALTSAASTSIDQLIQRQMACILRQHERSRQVGIFRSHVSSD